MIATIMMTTMGDMIITMTIMEVMTIMLIIMGDMMITNIQLEATRIMEEDTLITEEWIYKISKKQKYLFTMRIIMMKTVCLQGLEVIMYQTINMDITNMVGINNTIMIP